MRQYEARHHGVAIVCGGGPGLHSDLGRALGMFPDAALLGCNFAPALVPGIQQVWTQHIEIAGKIKHECPGVKVHSRPRHFQTKSGGAQWFLGVSKAQEDEVDYLWPDLGWVAGSSGFCAGLWARHGLGFDTVILAGVPLDYDRRYDDKYRDVAVKANRVPQHDFGKHYASSDSIEHWQQCIRMFTEQGKTGGIYSMSGFTREWLGEPQRMAA